MMEILDASAEYHFQTPAKRIHDETDLRFFLSSKAYADIMTFLIRLNTAMVPRKLAEAPPVPTAAESSSKPPPPPPASGSEKPASSLKLPPPRRAKAPIQTWEINSSAITLSPAVQSLSALLNELESLIQEAPPDPGPRRYGNVSFRKWYTLVEERAADLLDKHVPVSPLLTREREGGRKGVMQELRSYFLGSFGSAQRLDYGTGHELSFLAFLAAVWKLGGFDMSTGREGAEERGIVLAIIEPYLRVMRRLIGTYTLEPAGSHGVWGLDDHFFLPYIFGSAQYAPAIAAGDAAPLEGSRAGAPRPDDVVKPAVVERERPVNMYFGAIGFVYDVKKGPFWEHSPQLYDISGVKDGWGKINKGLIKMYVGEVLSKFPVVQHFPFGQLFRWERDAAVPEVPASALSPSPVAGRGGSALTGGSSAHGIRPGMPTATHSGVTSNITSNSTFTTRTTTTVPTAAPWAATAAAAESRSSMKPPDSSTPRAQPGQQGQMMTSLRNPHGISSTLRSPVRIADVDAREGFKRGQSAPGSMKPPTSPDPSKDSH